MKNVMLVACLLTLLTSSFVFAGDLNQKTVSEVVEKIKTGKKVSEDTVYPTDQTQVFSFFQRWPGVGVAYFIDIRAKLCFISSVAGSVMTGLTPVPCKSLKDGYPLVAPIIDWEK